MERLRLQEVGLGARLHLGRVLIFSARLIVHRNHLFNLVLVIQTLHNSKVVGTNLTRLPDAVPQNNVVSGRPNEELHLGNRYGTSEDARYEHRK